ncbi:La-related protein 6 [Amphibalanus amphitrite]|uniref:La-related protein 6 n=1 Tax=Amphibalanus amphitrite TaxID=1232801 RepID=A0A6A4VNH7_AMPAM|nr:la-related protein 6-like [Amphibalanus amphitrite]KAF0290841.1 La-related protein 6 [Amphibalanus amphitrite]
MAVSEPVLMVPPASEPVPIAAPARPPAAGGSSVSSDSDESSLPTALLSSAASSDGRDSGVEADAFEPPDEIVTRAIVDAVEFYFSDENLLRDAFLLKHVKRNKEGFVSVKLISSFKRVKHISRDWRVVAHALQHSDQIELSDAGTKARRLQPLPEHDETVTSRTVVAVNLPLQNPTIASVSELFGACGDISSIRVLKPGSNIPVEVRAAFNKHPDVAWENVNCAVVEFDLQEQARRARDTMTAEDPTDPAGMHILPIGKVSNKKKSRQEEIAEEAASGALLGVIAADAQKKRRQRRKKNVLAHSDSRGSISGTDGELSSTPGSRRNSPPHGCVPLLSHPPPLLSVPPPLLSHPPPLLSQPPPLLSCPPPLLPLPAGLVPRRQSPPSGGRSSVFASTDIRLLPDGGASISKPPPAAPSAAKPPAAGGKPASERRQKKSSPPSFDGPPPPGTCPWIQRRKASGVQDGDRRGSLIAQEHVLRAPRGPDGTSGFTAALRRSRPAPAASAAAATPAQN